MVSKLFGKLKKLKQDNQGAAIVIVIVAIAFIGMLIAMLTYMAYYNYLMKHVDRSSKDNFYSAEYALDILNAGLQKDISDSMSEAYVVAAKITTPTQDAAATNITFQKQFVQSLQKRLEATPATSPVTYDMAHLTAMWTKAGLAVTTVEGAEGACLKAKDNKNYLTVTNTDYMTLNNLRIVYTDSRGYVSIIETDIRLKVPTMDFAQTIADLDVENYSLIANVSVINDSLNTDTVPNFGDSVSFLKGDADTKVSGNVYGGKKGIMVANKGGLQFIEDPTDAANPSITNMSYKLIADSLNMENTLTNGKGIKLDPKFDTYVADINVTSAKFDGDGNMYVGDDLDIAGKKSNVTLKGSYMGYGNQNTSASGSSSILINGAATTLNVSGLRELMLSGHAYVGAKRYDADKDRIKMVNGIADPSKIGTADDYTTAQINSIMNGATPDTDKINKNQEDYDKILNSNHYSTYKTDMENSEAVLGRTYSPTPKNETDILTGESISVKANQLFYMVPTECVGYLRNTNVQKYARNPMTVDEYNYLLNDFDYDKFTSKNTNGTYVYPEYIAIRAEYAASHTGFTADKEVPKTAIDANKVPGDLHTFEPVRLSVLWDKLSSAAFTQKYKAVYRRVNGTVMVYLYLDFGTDESLANAFFKTYAEYDKDAVNNYVNSYIESLTWSSSLGENSAGLTLAGNAFRMNGRNVVMLKDSTENSAKYNEMATNQDKYTDIYTALMHILKIDRESMTSTQEANDLFDNLVDPAALTRIDALGTGGKTFDDSVGGAAPVAATISAYVGKSDVLYPSGKCPQDKTAVIITSGDVYVKANYNGLIIAGGNIYIGEGCNSITYNPARVKEALRLSVDAGGNTTHVYDVFGPSGEASYGLGGGSSSSSDESIAVHDLITYQNWKKE